MNTSGSSASPMSPFLFFNFNITHRATHKGLVDAHRLLMIAYAEVTKRSRSDDHEPLVIAQGIVGTAASLFSPTPIPMVKLSPLSQSDYPGIKYWNKADWKKTENARKDSSDLEVKGGGRGGARSSKGENVMMLYIENADGTPVDGTLAGSIREFARSIWREFHSQGIAPGRWGDAPREVRDKYCHEMETAFAPLRFCDNHWKAHAIATSIYSQWYHTFDKKRPAIKEESTPCDEPERKKSKTISTGDLDADDAQSPYSEEQPNTVESTPKAITPTDPLYVCYTLSNSPYLGIAVQIYLTLRHLHDFPCLTLCHRPSPRFTAASTVSAVAVTLTTVAIPI